MVCISWYNKSCRFLMKKCWCQQRSMGVSRYLCLFWIFFRWDITVASFTIEGYVWQILGEEAFSKWAIINRVKVWKLQERSKKLATRYIFTKICLSVGQAGFFLSYSQAPVSTLCQNNSESLSLSIIITHKFLYCKVFLQF